MQYISRHVINTAQLDANCPSKKRLTVTTKTVLINLFVEPLLPDFIKSVARNTHRTQMTVHSVTRCGAYGTVLSSLFLKCNDKTVQVGHAPVCFAYHPTLPAPTLKKVQGAHKLERCAGGTVLDVHAHQATCVFHPWSPQAIPLKQIPSS